MNRLLFPDLDACACEKIRWRVLRVGFEIAMNEKKKKGKGKKSRVCR